MVLISANTVSGKLPVKPTIRSESCGYKRLPTLGGFLVLAGFGLYEQPPVILLFALPWLLLAHLFVILYEEPHLRTAFGSPYVGLTKS